MSAPTHAVVRVRWERGTHTWQLLPITEARALTTELLSGVVDCGDAHWFVHFTGYDGRETHIRGREVIAIECVPDLPDRQPPPARTGTDFLRQVAGVTS